MRSSGCPSPRSRSSWPPALTPSRRIDSSEAMWTPTALPRRQPAPGSFGHDGKLRARGLRDGPGPRPSRPRDRESDLRVRETHSAPLKPPDDRDLWRPPAQAGEFPRRTLQTKVDSRRIGELQFGKHSRLPTSSKQAFLIPPTGLNRKEPPRDVDSSCCQTRRTF